MKKQIFAVLCVLLVAFAPLSLAQASVAPRNQSLPAPKAFLINSATGERIELPVQVYSEYLGNGKYVSTYTTGVSFFSPNISNAPLANLKSDCHWDTSYSVQSCMNAYYSEETTISGKYAVSIDHYNYKWYRADTQVSMSGAYARAMCFGYFEPSGTCVYEQRLNIGSPSSGSWYTISPSWRGRFVDITPSSGQVGHMWVHLTRGTRGWDMGWCMSVGGGAVLNMGGCY
jgi:hypothetical protein